MNLSKHKTLALLDLFRVKNPSYPHEEKLSHYMPLVWEGRPWIGAAMPNGFILVSETWENKVPPPRDPTVNLKGILPNVIKEVELSKEDLIQSFDLPPLEAEDEKTECQSCDGNGEFEHYDHTYQCMQCLSSGEIGTGRKIKIRDPRYAYLVQEKIINYTLMERLLTVINEADPPYIKYQVTKENPAISQFSLGGDIIIGLAGWLPGEEDLLLIDLSEYATRPQDRTILSSRTIDKASIFKS